MTRHCFYCGEQVDPTDRGTWHRVVGWERKALAGSRRSGSDIALREPRDEFACNGCVALKKSGFSVDQETLI